MLALSAARRLLRPPGDLLPPPGLACIWATGARGCSGAGAGSQNPVVYLEVGADNQPLGRVVLEVRTRGMRGPVVRPGPGYGGRRAARSGRAGGRGGEGRREGLERVGAAAAPVLFLVFLSVSSWSLSQCPAT